MKAREEHCCKIINMKSVARRKGLILLVMLAIAAVVGLVVEKYFYFLDAYLYTYEFYWLFNLNNLQTANLPMFADYFRPMGITTEALPQIIFSHLVQNFYKPFTKPILIAAVTSAFGAGLGSFFSYAAMLAVGLSSHAVGAFFLGDVIPWLTGQKLGNYRREISTPAAVALPLLFAVPWLPISFVAAGGSILNIPFRSAMQFMFIGFAVRLFWLLTMPGLFV